MTSGLWADGSILVSDDLRGWSRRAFLRAGGLSAEAVRRRPIIGICTSASELNPCNQGLDLVAEAVKQGVVAAGGTALVFPTISLAEQFVFPSSMYLRNLMAMDVEEMIRCSPIDGVVLLGGCDKTVPAQLMGAASAGKPAIALTAGPRECGTFRDRPVVTDDFWTLARARQSGDISDLEWAELEGTFAPSVGVCNVMGTAMTMAVLAESLGMALPGSALLPATNSRRTAMAQATGARIVELVAAGVTPEDVLTLPAIENALRVLMAMGGSTNAVIHLEAIAGRLGLHLGLDLVQQISDTTPLVLGVAPSGPYALQDFDAVGGVPALLQVLAPLLNTDAIAADGRTIGAVAEHATRSVGACLRDLEDPFEPTGGLVVLRGSLAPDGAIFKRAAAPERLWVHRGPALVYDDYRTAVSKSMDPDLPVTPDSIIVMCGAGPVGGPGMPEIGMVPIPIALRQAGITEMVCVTDARMSGTQHGATILHVAPEAAVGGPIGLVRDGDEIVFDAMNGVLDLLVDPTELDRRRHERQAGASPDGRSLVGAPPRRGYQRMYVEHVLQATEGCDFDFLRAAD